MLGPQLPEARHAMHDEPVSPPSGLSRELAAESQSSLPTPSARLVTIGIGLAWIGLLLAAFYTYAVPAADPFAFRAALNAGMVLLATGLIVTTLAISRAIRPRGRAV